MFLSCLLVLVTATARVQAQRTFDEREIKATFLFNFAQFVDWPRGSFTSPGAPLVIGVLGDDPFGAVLDDVIRGETVKNRRLVSARFGSVEEIGDCHILFVSGSQKQEYARILETLRGRPILTVGETEGFADSGGMIRFITERGHVRLRINLGASRSAGLTISSQLLRAADVVGRGQIR